MRTNIEIDDDLLAEARRVAGTTTKRETVELALRELVARDRRAQILRLQRKVRWEGDLAASRAGRGAGAADTRGRGGWVVVDPLARRFLADQG